MLLHNEDEGRIVVSVLYIFFSCKYSDVVSSLAAFGCTENNPTQCPPAVCTCHSVWGALSPIPRYPWCGTGWWHPERILGKVKTELLVLDVEQKLRNIIY
jgi:hypothetical protein